MPIIETIKINKHSNLFIWSISETEVELNKLTILNTTERDKYNSFKSESRRKEYLATRAMCQQILGKEVFIENDKHGKPYLINSNFKISISHSKNIAGIIISRYNELSLDIEYLSNRVENIAKKFLSQKELGNISKDKRIIHLYLYWCTKECLIKLYGKKNIHLIDELFVQDFDPEEQYIIAYYKKDNNKKAFMFEHKRLENHLIVWSSSSISEVQE